MKKKKALALLLTAAMTVGMLAGCGGSDSAATAGNAETADTACGRCLTFNRTNHDPFYIVLL